MIAIECAFRKGLFEADPGEYQSGMRDPILQSHLPILPWLDQALWRLPGIQPLDPDRWLEVDDAYAAQMAEKARLIASGAAVHAMAEAARPAAEEVLDMVLHHLARMPGFVVQVASARTDSSKLSSPAGTHPAATLCTVIRPDGVRVVVDRDAPLLTLGALVQEDICLLEKQGDEHVLTAALLCFPASWTLAEKFGRPLTTIHAPVAPYDDQMARRVQRMFDTIRPDRPLWRMNALLYADPTLHQPKSGLYLRPRTGARAFLRSEKQCLLRSPVSDAVVFSIHTYVVHASTVPEADLHALEAAGH